MKEEANNEMDLMLRQLAGTMNKSVAHPENGEAGGTSEVHLDADELNAYAENALPPATRSRYTEHLADCTRCRQIVSQLSQASGFVFEEKTSAQPAISGLRQFLSSFFSPMVLRYAVPALGLILVAALGLFVFRQRSPVRQAATEGRTDSVAQSTNPATPAESKPESAGLTNQVEKQKPQNVAPLKAGEEQTAANKKLDAAEADTARVERESEKRQEEQVRTVDQIAAAPPAPAPASETKAAEPSGDKKTNAVRGLDDDRKGQAIASAPNAAVSVEQQKELAKTRDNESGARVGGFAVSESAKAKNEVSRARAQPSAGTADSTAARRADKDEAETRSVAGRQFRRTGSLWVDTAYDSRATTNVVRGSEQYRALIADEPSIKTIADQLDGEVIVMWKNRAYRIR